MKTLTFIHVAISLAAILSGFVVLFGMLTRRELPGWTKLFLVTTVATSATGFLFPFHGITPAGAVGIISLVVLAVAIYALYAGHLAKAWRKIYVVSALFAFYLNVFVLIVQLFQKVPALREIAPTQNDPPFKIAQLVVLAVFIVLGILAAIRFRAGPVQTAHAS